MSHAERVARWSPERCSEATIPASGRKWGAAIGLSFAVAAIGVWWIGRGAPGGGVVLGVGGFGLFVSVLAVLPGATFLRLAPEGFEQSRFFVRKPLVPWRDVASFEPFTFARPFLRRAVRVHLRDPSSLPERIRRANRAVVGADEWVPAEFGMSAEETARLLEAWRGRHGA
jgi:hypothetical protein